VCFYLNGAEYDIGNNSSDRQLEIKETRAGIFKLSMGARNLVGIGL
jgi:hypothetical protein